MAVIESGIAVPTRSTPVKRKLGALSQEIYDTLGGCEVGDSFALPGVDYKKAALVGGRQAARLLYTIRTAPEGDGCRVWRIDYVAPKARKAKAAVAAA